MKVLVFGGSGKIGSAVAWDLARDDEVNQIGLVGRNADTLNEVKRWIGKGNIAIHTADVADEGAVKSLMKQYDVGVLALPDRRRSYKIAHYAVEAGLNIVDMLEEYHRRPDAYEVEGLELPQGMTLDQYGDWLHETAIKNKVTFLDGMGFAPGLSNVTVGEAIRKMDRAESAVARVGGVPSKKDSFGHPLRYMITWAFDHVLREYMIRVKVVKKGRVVEVDAATDLETFRFNKLGKDEELQCAITPGMPSFIYTRPQLREFAEKTVRWPGHWPGVLTLKECGLLDLEPVDFKGQKVSPREFLLSRITPRLKVGPGETDVCVMYNTVVGRKKGRKVKIEYHMWDAADRKNNISSMMRVTGFPVAIAARMIARGQITQKGIVAPEDAVDSDLYPEFIKELKKRNIKILETISYPKK
jgi:saccharopine dehydrogenase-like NADP-dependent oxidoreductase